MVPTSPSTIQNRLILPASYIFALLLAAISLPWTSHGLAARPVTISAEYNLNLAGLKFAKISLYTFLNNGTYTIAMEAENLRLGRLIKFGGATTSSGQYSQSYTNPEKFNIRYHIRKKEQAIAISFNGDGVENLNIVPQRGASNNRVPLLDEHRQNVIDPLGAFMFPLPNEPLTGENACNREIAIFDGRYRYNLNLHYIRTQTAPDRKFQGQPANVYVCGMRYMPIAGHRLKDKDDFFKWANHEGVEIWLLPLDTAGVLLPYRGIFPTPLGQAIFHLGSLRVF